MQDLVIRLTGEIQRSNFEPWRSTFLARLESIKTDLVTDEDFGHAAQLVKDLKGGEDALKKAKASALDQSADIQRLFAAIDEVAEVARQTRLTLQRQIKQRKQDLKDQAIDEGVARVRAMIARQSRDFQRLDPARYLDRALFVRAIKGKAGLKGVQEAIDRHCDRIHEAIEEKALLVSSHAAWLSGLPSEQQILFQDRGQLLDMGREQLAEVIDHRLAAYRQEQERQVLGSAHAPASSPLPPPTEPPGHPIQPDSAHDSLGEFQVTVLLRCTQGEAQEIARRIRGHLQGEEALKEMRLTAAPKATGATESTQQVEP